MKNFTREELARYNGKNGAPCFIAYRGKIYDVSGSFLWRNGKHQVFHTAGVDLTDGIQKAPHKDDLLDRFPVVGMLYDGNVE